MTDAAVADHGFLDGRLTLREPRRGHRSGTDAILLAAASRLQPGQHLIDVGAGAGAVALAALCRVADATATLVERDPAMADLARHNVEANGLKERATVIEADLFDPALLERLREPRPHVVVSNPPFYLAGHVRASNVPQKAMSHVLTNGGHGDWMGRLLRIAVSRCRVVVIQHPDALPALLEACTNRASVRFRSIHPRRDREAIRIILAASPGARSPLVIDAPLVVHTDEGPFTPRCEALHRGEGWL